MSTITQYTIKKGNHYSGIHCHFHWKQTNMTRIINFDKSCLYTLSGTDKMEINKLFGLSYGLAHNNSARFGWRTNASHPGKIEILAYCYVNGGLNEPSVSLGFVDVGTSYVCTIETSPSSFSTAVAGPGSCYTLTLTDISNKIIGSTKVFNVGSLPKWGYWLYPYFGGVPAAPQDVAITLTIT
jgi:hypothetical protein